MSSSPFTHYAIEAINRLSLVEESLFGCSKNTKLVQNRVHVTESEV